MLISAWALGVVAVAGGVGWAAAISARRDVTKESLCAVSAPAWILAESRICTSGH